MSRKILFSPVGGTDPISAVNAYDGSLLHICRYYKPDVVILYMSAEVLEAQEKDNRYKYCLHQLMEMQHREMKIEEIERPDLTEVQEFDFFYDDFREEIQKIYSGMEESDELLINISSGTPAMKSTLMVLGTFGEYPCKLIQVVTPEKKMNEHYHRDYDVETLWELNEDNLPNAQNRCVEINCPSLLKLKQEEAIKKHINVYDYQAALTIAESMPKTYTRQYFDLLKIGNYRMRLQLSEIDKMKIDNSAIIVPIRDSDKRIVFEYTLGLQAKLFRKEYIDFIRGISPIVFILFKRILKKSCNIDIDIYCSLPYNEKIKKWDKNKLLGEDRQTKCVRKYAFPDFDEEKDKNKKDNHSKEKDKKKKGNHSKEKDKKKNGNHRFAIVYSKHLKNIIDENTTDISLKELVQSLRNVEEKARNVAAHEICTMTDKDVKDLSDYSPDRIMQFIKSAFPYAGINVKAEYWNSYDDMNKMIMDSM